MVSEARRPSKRSPAFMKHADHAKLWRLVEGAVADAFEALRRIAGHRVEAPRQLAGLRVVGAHVTAHAELRAAWEAKGRPWFSRARGGSDTHTAAWPALTLCLIYGPALALGAWMAWRVWKRGR